MIFERTSSELSIFTPLEKATDFNRWSTDSQADGGLMPPSAQTVRERSSLTGFTDVRFRNFQRIIIGWGVLNTILLIAVAVIFWLKK
jgi:hypothetical protein